LNSKNEKNFWGGAQPTPQPFGASILAPSALNTRLRPAALVTPSFCFLKALAIALSYLAILAMQIYANLFKFIALISAIMHILSVKKRVLGI